jgi:archaellum biogenesis ATPase FlaH
MGYWRKVKEIQTTSPAVTSTETVDQVLKYPFKDVPERNISKTTCERFGIRAGVSEKDGKTIDAYYFPFYNKKGQVVGFKKQNIRIPKEDQLHWSAIGSVSIGCKLFGQEVAENLKRKKTKLIITEGEWDAVSVFQSCVDHVKGTKYEGLEPMVVSITLGTANAVESILHNETFVKDYDSLVLFFDDDHCTPAETQKGVMKGHEAREAVANALVGSGMSLFTITPAAGFKDASDYMQAGRNKDLAELVQFSQRAYSAEKIVKASDISLEEILAPRPEGVYVTAFPKLMEKIHGFRTRELVLLTAPSGVGKSTVSSFFANAFIDKGERVGQIYLEETNKETLQRSIASKLKVNYLKFKNNPTSVATYQQIREAYEEVCKDDKVIMLGHFGSLPISELMAKIKHMHLIEGCKYIILDHLSVVISGSAIENERKELDMVMTELAAFCAANEVCIIAISHINRTAANDFKAPKDKNGQESDKPFWVKITKEMMRGSAALEQLSFIIIGLEPEIKADRSRGRVRLTVLKNRPYGYLGVADTFSIDEDDWSVLLYSDEVAVDF